MTPLPAADGVIPARPDVERLRGYSAPLEGRRGLLRLDFNENTVGPSPRVVEALRAIPAEEFAVYPEYDGLREALVANLAAAPAGLAHPLSGSNVGIFNGVDAAIHAVLQAYGAAGDTLLTTSPTFGYYAPCAGMQGMVIEAVPHVMPDFRFPLEAVRAALEREPRVLMLCNPNNPTGTRLAPERVLALAAAAPGTLVVVDELYEAFTGDSVLQRRCQRPAQPAGVALPRQDRRSGRAAHRLRHRPCRCGRSRQPRHHLRRQQRGRYRGLAALEDQAYTDRYVEEVRARDYLVAGLTQSVPSPLRRQLPARLAAAIGWAVEQQLRSAGILVRSMAGKPQMDGALREHRHPRADAAFPHLRAARGERRCTSSTTVPSPRLPGRVRLDPRRTCLAAHPEGLNATWSHPAGRHR